MSISLYTPDQVVVWRDSNSASQPSRLYLLYTVNMPFVLVRTRASGAIVTIDAPQVLLKHLKAVCVTKEDENIGYKSFKFQWLYASESFRGGLEGMFSVARSDVRAVWGGVILYMQVHYVAGGA